MQPISPLPNSGSEALESLTEIITPEQLVDLATGPVGQHKFLGKLELNIRILPENDPTPFTCLMRKVALLRR